MTKETEIIQEKNKIKTGTTNPEQCHTHGNTWEVIGQKSTGKQTQMESLGS
jgi:hypothetical protein